MHRRVARRWFRRRIAAQVGTDTATIYAIAPEMLHRVIQDGEWFAVADAAWGDAPQHASDESYLFDFDRMDSIIRQHGGATFTTGADGTWDMKIVPQEGTVHAITERGFTPPYGTPEFGKMAHRVANRYLLRQLVDKLKRKFSEIDPMILEQIARAAMFQLSGTITAQRKVQSP